MNQNYADPVSITQTLTKRDSDFKDLTRKSVDAKYSSQIFNQAQGQPISAYVVNKSISNAQSLRASPEPMMMMNQAQQNAVNFQKFANPSQLTGKKVTAQDLVHHKRQLSLKQQQQYVNFNKSQIKAQMQQNSVHENQQIMGFYPSDKYSIDPQSNQQKIDSRHSIQIQNKYSSSGAPSYYASSSQEKIPNLAHSQKQTPTDAQINSGIGSIFSVSGQFNQNNQGKKPQINQNSTGQAFIMKQAQHMKSFSQNHSPNVIKRIQGLNISSNLSKKKNKQKQNHLYGSANDNSQLLQQIKLYQNNKSLVNQSLEMNNIQSNSIFAGSGSQSTRFQEQLNYGNSSLQNPKIIQDNSSAYFKQSTVQTKLNSAYGMSIPLSKTPSLNSPNKSLDFTTSSKGGFLPSQNQNNPYQLKNAQIKMNISKQQQQFFQQQQQAAQHRKNKSMISGFNQPSTTSQSINNHYQQITNNFLDQSISGIESQSNKIKENTSTNKFIIPSKTGMKTPDIAQYMQNIKHNNVANYQEQNYLAYKRKSQSKTPAELEFSTNTNNSMILDGGTGSEGTMGLKVGLAKIHSNSNPQQNLSQSAEFTKKIIQKQINSQDLASNRSKISVSSLQKSKDRLQNLKQQQQKLKQQLNVSSSHKAQRYDLPRDETEEIIELDDFNQKDIHISVENTKHKSKEFQITKQPKIASKLMNKQGQSINITAEALAIGKIPTEEVARLISTKTFKSDKDYMKFSPRTREMAMISTAIKDCFANGQDVPVTTTDFYRAGKMLGKGAFGKVSLGMHKLCRKLVAIKSINKEYLSEEKQKNKVMHEVGILSRMRHPSVVKLYETFETGRHILLVMELCAGGDLLNYVRKRRKLKEDIAKVLFKQIIEGLGYIHSKGVIHRDIKLDNILLDGKGRVKIADFGVSKAVKPGEVMREQCGTPAYIAPEIIRDKGYSGFKADIWSAGVVLFAMLYGTVPFKANNMQDLHQLILKAKYNLKDEITEEAKNLLRGMLETDVQKRLNIRQILNHPWMQFQEDDTLIIFNEQEREVIKTEFTYNDPSRWNRNEPNLNKDLEPWDCFTELNLDSMNCTLRNASSKSIILAPFNSSISDDEKDFEKSCRKQAQFVDKKSILKFAARCRDQDRQYEINNNAELDNGVYHKFVYSSEQSGKPDDQEDEEEEEKFYDNHGIRQNDLEQLTSKMKDSTRNLKQNEDSFANSFEESKSYRSIQRRIQSAKVTNSKLQGEISQHAKNLDIKNQASPSMDEDNMESFQSNYSFVIEAERVQVLVDFGFPKEYVIRCLTENEANYCTAGYYLLGLDQNY